VVKRLAVIVRWWFIRPRRFINDLIEMRKLFSLFGLFFFFFPGLVLASPDSQTLGVSPAIIEEVLTPGEPTTTKITLFNVTDSPLPVRSSVDSFLVVDEICLDRGKNFDVSAWISLDPVDLIVPAQNSRQVEVTVLPSKNAEPGGHYATIYFQVLLPEQKTSFWTSPVSARVGVLGLFIVKGKVVKEASLGQPQVAKLNQLGPIDFLIPIINQGNVHLFPQVNLKVSRASGQEITTLTVPKRLVLPGTTKQLGVVWPKRFVFGRFVAQAFWALDQGEIISSPPISFWVIPWLPILVLLVVLVLLVIFRKRLILAFRVLTGQKTQN